MALPTIRELLKSPGPKAGVVARGWIKTRRDSKVMSFAELNDGSCRESLQAVFSRENGNFAELLPSLVAGAAVEYRATLVASPAAGQKYELQARQVKLYGGCDPEKYPIQKKKASDEFLRTVAHLRPRTNKYAAMLRIRAELAYAVHTYFRDNGFFYVHTPILTASDCEGAGQMFTATALDLSKLAALPRTEAGEIDFSKDLLGKKTYPRFPVSWRARAWRWRWANLHLRPDVPGENSIPPLRGILADRAGDGFYELDDDMELAEDFIKAITRASWRNAPRTWSCSRNSWSRR